MGNELVRHILWATPPYSHLPGRTLHCLLLMATRAHDSTGLYFAGVEWLTLQLGYQLNEGGRRNTLRHISTLEKHGLVRRTGSTRGRKWVYQLTITGPLHGPLGPVDNP